jgi:translation initiation factor 2 alpha subunit (eIF-2alpha)
MAIDEAAKNLRDGDAYLNLMNAFGSLTRYFNKAIEQRKKRLIDCQLEEKTRKHTIQSIREDIEKPYRGKTCYFFRNAGKYCIDID